MGLESSTYINGLTAAWPIAGDLKSQGDDHIRLIKSVLQNTFPNATKAFRLPSSNVVTANISLTAAHDNALLVCVATTAFGVFLPALGVGDAGWSVRVMKQSGTFVNVVPAGGTIASQAGGTPLIRVEQLCQPATFVWDGGGWYCWKPGGLIGEVVSFDGATIPAGWLESLGQAYDTTAYCELFAMIGIGTLRQRAGRVEAALDPGYGILTGNTIPAGGHILGAVGGVELHALTIAQIPSHAHGGATGSMNRSNPHDHPVTGNNATGTGHYGNFGNFDGLSAPIGVGSIGVGARDINHEHSIAAEGGSSWHTNQPPTIVVRKLIRAC